MARDGAMTIDQLAERVGMTVRNVRAHQSRGLLGAPELRGRTGYYDAEHVARLELIKDLQAEGFNLEAIRRILERTPGSSTAAVLGFTRAAAEPFGDEQPELMDRATLREPWGDQLSDELVQRVVDMGFLAPVGAEQMEVASPRLMALAAELADLGIPAQATVDVLGELRDHADAAAAAYVKLFIEHVLRPLQQRDGGVTSDRWDEIRAAMDRLRPSAGTALLAVFGVVMTERVERAVEQELARIGEAPDGA